MTRNIDFNDRFSDQIDFSWTKMDWVWMILELRAIEKKKLFKNYTREAIKLTKLYFSNLILYRLPFNKKI